MNAPHPNLLPFDGTAFYYGNVLDRQAADHFFDRLSAAIAWRHDEVMMFGKLITTKRKTAWYGDPGREYTYSGITREPLPWTPELLELKPMVEKITGAAYNSCLLNLYHDGEEGMSWHADNERELGPAPNIASISLGAERRFSFKHRATGQTLSLQLEHGSLLLMAGATQQFWLHALPKSKKIIQPRINLTFRLIQRGVG